MKSRAFLLAAIAFALPLTTLAAEPAHHQHDAAPGKLELNAGQKWASDAPLRKAMDSMKEQVAAALPAAHAGKLTPQQYRALGAALTGQIGYVVQNCKLEPEADAQLHTILGQLTAGIDTIEGRQGQDRALGVVKAAQALNAYGKYFEHAGWQPVKLPG